MSKQEGTYTIQDEPPTEEDYRAISEAKGATITNEDLMTVTATFAQLMLHDLINHSGAYRRAVVLCMVLLNTILRIYETIAEVEKARVEKEAKETLAKMGKGELN